MLHTPKNILIKFISIGSYFPEKRTFGTLITTTIVFRLVLQNYLTMPPINDPLPREFGLLT